MRNTGPTRASGYSRGGGSDMRRIVVSFDNETFEQVRSLAVSDGVSFAEAVRLLVDWGLEASPSSQHHINDHRSNGIANSSGGVSFHGD